MLGAAPQHTIERRRRKAHRLRVVAGDVDTHVQRLPWIRPVDKTEHGVLSTAKFGEVRDLRELHGRAAARRIQVGFGLPSGVHHDDGDPGQRIGCAQRRHKPQPKRFAAAA